MEVAIYRIDGFYRYVWSELENGYTLLVDAEHADRYLQHVALQDHENSYKKGIEKALKLLFKWKHHIKGAPEWEPEFSFTVSEEDSSLEDCLTRTEMAMLREAALEYGSIPSYTSLSPDERDRWKEYLAQRFGVPKSEIGTDDWKRADSWKYPSLIWTTLDTGLRPDEVERAKTFWLDLENGILQIPNEEVSSEDDQWIVALRPQTTRALENWLEERAQYSKYDDTDLLWLTRKKNPYQSNSLNYLLRKLCDIGEIDDDGRQITWLTLRDTVGKHMAEDGDLEHVREQLRHTSSHTVRRYGSAVEKRKRILERP
ncbi:site-specific integrase [Natrialba swarupiae]|uniref:Site-specific integrase n=1 Tax=Natrialba swarupiae TaxID=2448032 RepID=A0A5D5AW83_9EURY|nr:site-specific integrase [Natrialba swarupiae]TYT63880.1 site-specific integrase [Natrialba swarupiae]